MERRARPETAFVRDLVKSFRLRYIAVLAGAGLVAAMPLAGGGAMAETPLELLNSHEETPADLTVRIVGQQWHWRFEYLEFAALSLESAEAQDAQRCQARPDGAQAALMLPAGTAVRFAVTANDGLYDLVVPALNISTSVLPGRLSEIVTEVPEDATGRLFYGGCAEACDAGTSCMPFAVKVVPQDDFVEWVRKVQAGSGYNSRALVPVVASAAAAAKQDLD